KEFPESRYTPNNCLYSRSLRKDPISCLSSRLMTRSYRVPLVWSRCSQETHFRPSFTPSSKAVFFASVSHVIWPPSRLNRGVVRTTSPGAPSLIINTFILEVTKEFGLRAPEMEVPMVPPPLNAEDCEENGSAGDLSDNST